MTPSNQAENMMSVATVAKNITHDASQFVRMHSPTDSIRTLAVFMPTVRWPGFRGHANL